MKRLILLSVMTTLLLACGKDNGAGPEEGTPTEDASFFFPIATGNIWRYYETGHQDATQSVRIWSAFTQSDTLYHLYGNKENIADTLHQDQWGRVYKRFNGKNLLWLDFSVADGGTYEYVLSEKLTYTVKVTRKQTIEYDGQKFESCIRFDFDVPDLKTEEMTYILAPEVGIVQQITAWNTKFLASWELQTPYLKKR